MGYKVSWGSAVFQGSLWVSSRFCWFKGCPGMARNVQKVSRSAQGVILRHVIFRDFLDVGFLTSSSGHVFAQGRTFRWPIGTILGGIERADSCAKTPARVFLGVEFWWVKNWSKVKVGIILK